MVYYQVEIAKHMTLIEHEKYRFLITDCPSQEYLEHYVREFRQHNVKHVVRACQSPYEPRILHENSIKTHDCSFPDGGIPSREIITKWIALVEGTFCNSTEAPTIAVHCIAGLGRAPVLVAIALIEYGMTPLDAIDYIRSKRRGAFNSKQIQFLDSYKRRGGLKKSFALFRLFTRKQQPSLVSCE